MQRIIGLLLVTVILSPASGLAQTRKRTSAKSNRPSAAPKAADVQREGAARVAEQIKLLTRFIYLLGGVAKGLETAQQFVRRERR